MINENLLTQSTTGSVSFENPDAATVLVNTKNQELNQSVENPSPLSILGAQIGTSAGWSVKAIYNKYQRSTGFDSEYNPFKDINFTSRGSEFVNKYGDYLLDSPNSDYTADALKKIDNQNIFNEVASTSPIASFIGQATGSIIDPISIIPFMGGAMVATRLARAGLFAAEGASLGAVGALAESENNPNFNKDTALYSIGGGLLLGGILGGFTRGIISKGLTKGIEKEIQEPMTGLMKPVSDIIPQELSVGAAENTDFNISGALDESAAYGTGIGRWLAKGAKYTSPNQVLLANPLATAKWLASKLGGFTGIKNKNLEGIATEWDVGSMFHTISAKDKITLSDTLDNAYKIHRQDGGKLSRAQFVNYSMYEHAIGGVGKDLGTGFTEGAKAIDDTLSRIWDESKALNIFSEDAKKEAAWMPHAWDQDKIAEDHIGFMNMIGDQLKRDNPKWSAEEIKNESYLIADDLRANDIANVPVTARKSYQAKSTRYRTFRVDNELAWKYMRNDWDSVLDSYIHQMSLARTFARDTRFGIRTNPYQSIVDIVNKDRETNILQLQKRFDQGEPQNIINKEIATINKAADQAIKISHGILDGLTGQADNRLGFFGNRFVKATTKIMRSYVYLNMMGSVAISQFPDTARSITYRLLDKIGFNGKAEELAKNFIQMSPEDRAFIAYHLEDVGSNSRIGHINDLDGDAGFGANVNHIIDKGIGLYNKINLMNWINKFNYRLIANDVVRKSLEGAQKLLDGKVEDGSYEAIELARFGLDKKNAKRFISQFEKNRVEINRYGAKIYDPNLTKWDSREAYEFASFIRRYVDRVIINPTPGSKPLLMSSSVGKTVFQFKGYQFGAFEGILLNNLQTFGLTKEHTQLVLMNILLANLAGAAVQVTKDTFTGKDIKLTPEYLAFAGFNNGGYAPIFDFLSNVADQHGLGLGSLLGQRKKSKFITSNTLEPFFGPSYNLIGNKVPGALGSMWNIVKKGKVSPKDVNNVTKAMPLQNLLWLNLLGRLTEN